MKRASLKTPRSCIHLPTAFPRISGRPNLPTCPLCGNLPRKPMQNMPDLGLRTDDGHPLPYGQSTSRRRSDRNPEFLNETLRWPHRRGFGIRSPIRLILKKKDYRCRMVRAVPRARVAKTAMANCFNDGLGGMAHPRRTPIHSPETKASFGWECQ
jgi:hypothetical protein